MRGRESDKKVKQEKEEREKPKGSQEHCPISYQTAVPLLS